MLDHKGDRASTLLAKTVSFEAKSSQIIDPNGLRSPFCEEA